MSNDMQMRMTPKDSWNYRLVQRRDGSFAVHEVYYEGDKAVSMTVKPVTLGPLETAQEVKDDLELISEALRKEVFVEPEWSGQ